MRIHLICRDTRGQEHDCGPVDVKFDGLNWKIESEMLWEYFIIDEAFLRNTETVEDMFPFDEMTWNSKVVIPGTVITMETHK